MVGQRPLKPSIQVRILVPEPLRFLPIWRFLRQNKKGTKYKQIYMTRKIFLIILIIMIIAVSIFLYLNGKKEGSLSLDSNDVPSTPINEICLKISQSHPDNILYCLAVTNQDMSYCDDSMMPEEKKLCQAMAGRDVSYCRQIKEQEPRKVCYYELSFLMSEIDYCEETENPNMCYFAFLYRLHWESRADEIKAEYCEKFDENVSGGQVMKNCCLAFKDQDPSLCQGNNYCLSFFKQPLSFCDNELELPGGGSASNDECLLHRALSEKDSSFCEMIESEDGRDGCFADMSTHISPDLSMCDKVVDSMVRDMCYTEAAMALAQ
jgi:hypothetical protein